MAQKMLVYWKDIPTQVIIKAGRKTAKRELPEYFIQSVDQCAMKLGAKDSDAYLEEWRRGAPQEVSSDLEAEADKAYGELIEAYPKDRLKALIQSGGVDDGTYEASSS